LDGPDHRERLRREPLESLAGASQLASASRSCWSGPDRPGYRRTSRTWDPTRRAGHRRRLHLARSAPRGAPDRPANVIVPLRKRFRPPRRFRKFPCALCNCSARIFVSSGQLFPLQVRGHLHVAFGHRVCHGGDARVRWGPATEPGKSLPDPAARPASPPASARVPEGRQTELDGVVGRSVPAAGAQANPKASADGSPPTVRARRPGPRGRLPAC